MTTDEMKERVLSAIAHECRLPYDDDQLPDTWPELADELARLASMSYRMAAQVAAYAGHARKNAEREAADVPA